MSKKEISREELESILSAHNISFSDIAKIANMVNGSNDDTAEAAVIKKEKKEPATIEYSLTKVSYPDFVVTKKSKIQTKELVIAPSCDGYFVRTLRKGGSWEVEQLSGEAWVSFFSDCPTDKLLTLPKEFYIATLERGKVFGDGLLEYFKIPHIKEMIKDKCAPKYEWIQFKQYNSWPNREHDIREQARIYSFFPVIYKEFFNHESRKVRDCIKREPGMVLFVYRVYGIEKTRDFINNYNLCLYDDLLSCCYASGKSLYDSLVEEEIYNKIYDRRTNDDSDRGRLWNDLCRYIADFPCIRMDYETFKEYVLYESYRMGYSNLRNFLTEWNDTLRMQQTLFGKFKEKYPTCLPVYHNKLVRRISGTSVYKDKAFISKFQASAEKLVKYNWENKFYKFIVPKTPNDVIEEADMQSNCLVNAHYMERVVGGTSILVFMRRKEQSDRSYITMEIVGNKINQAYLASNRIPSATDKTNIKEYAEHFKLLYE